MKKNELFKKIQKVLSNKENLEKVVKGVRIMYALCFLVSFICTENFYAMDAVTEPMNRFNLLMSTVVSLAGEFFLLWAIFEWGLSLQSGNGGMMEGQSIKKMWGGLFMIFAPDLATFFKS